MGCLLFPPPFCAASPVPAAQTHCRQLHEGCTAQLFWLVPVGLLQAGREQSLKEVTATLFYLWGLAFDTKLHLLSNIWACLWVYRFNSVLQQMICPFCYSSGNSSSQHVVHIIDVGFSSLRNPTKKIGKTWRRDFSGLKWEDSGRPCGYSSWVFHTCILFMVCVCKTCQKKALRGVRNLSSMWQILSMIQPSCMLLPFLGSPPPQGISAAGAPWGKKRYVETPVFTNRGSKATSNNILILKACLALKAKGGDALHPTGLVTHLPFMTCCDSLELAARHFLYVTVLHVTTESSPFSQGDVKMNTHVNAPLAHLIARITTAQYF